MLLNNKEKTNEPQMKNEIKGSVHEVKDKVKETLGKVTNDPN